MKVKAIDIARELGISKATVSLALNNRPGVSEETKKEILQCKERMEQGRPALFLQASGSRQIRVVFASRGYKSTKGLNIDLRTPVLKQFEADAKKNGYSMLFSMIELSHTSIEDVVREYNEDNTEGIIIHATDLKPDEVAAFEKIRKPMVIYDNVSPSLSHHCVMPNNQPGVVSAVRYLVRKGRKNIQYLAHSDDIYHFESSRRGYYLGMKEAGELVAPPKVITLGSDIEECREAMLRYLDTDPDADAFISENYQVTIGAMQALMERQVEIPGKISIIGIDDLPAYMTGNIKMTSVVIPHVSRAHLASLLLFDEMAGETGKKSIVYTECPLSPGNSTD